jgi:predicted nucleic acid-binding protein
MSIVSNTGPLIALAKADRMDLLPELYGTVHIPPAVHRELLGKTGPEADRLDVALAAWLKVADRVEPSSEVEGTLQAIDAGEREAILLAQRLGLTVILDDRLGREAARRLGLPVTGTVGVIIEAKRAGLVPAVRPVLEAIQVQGYWLSDALIDLAALLAGD